MPDELCNLITREMKTPDENILDVTLFPDELDRHDFSIIGLHGRDADKHAFFPFVRQMGFLHTRWILPSAPFGPANSPGTRRWFDKETDNREQMESSRALVHQLIDAEIQAGVAPENVFLVGFSQGAVMALYAGLRYSRRLGGLVALSGYLALPTVLADEAHAANRRTPVFLSHGRRDETLTVDHGRDAVAHLQSLGYAVEYHEDDSAHRINSRTLRHIRAFLHRHMYGLPLDDPRMLDEHIAPF